MPVRNPEKKIIAQSPAKAILFGEHSVNRGQLALATAVDLRTYCEILPHENGCFEFLGAGRHRIWKREELVAFGKTIGQALETMDTETVRACLSREFFASSSYILSQTFTRHSIPGLKIRIESAIPIGCGLGSGGAVHVALSLALAEWVAAASGTKVSRKEIGTWAYWGDRVAHGGVASGLDTQTSLHGGVVEYCADREARDVDVAEGLCLVIGDTGIEKGSTGNVNSRLKSWIEQRPHRMHFFREMGRIARYAKAALGEGNWPEVGELMNLNHLLLQKIGVSCPELDQLVDAALAAGANGAKLSGSGGGGIMIALTGPDHRDDVVQAIETHGGKVIPADVDVPGAGLADRITASSSQNRTSLSQSASERIP